MAEASCFEILGTFPESEYSNTLVLGGIATAALEDPDTQIRPEEQLILAAPGADKPSYRPNGTRRDVDILVPSVVSSEEASRLRGLVEDAIGGRLEVSVFGVDPYQHRLSLPGRTQETLGRWVSHRTFDGLSGRHFHELFPLRVELDPAVYTPWRLQLPSGVCLPVLNPAAHAAMYGIRSVGGLRPKDKEKVAAMWRNIHRQSAVFEEQLHDGHLQGLRELSLGVRALSHSFLRIPGGLIRPEASVADVSIARLKARLARALEDQRAIVDFVQDERVQGLLRPFVGAAKAADPE